MSDEPELPLDLPRVTRLPKIEAHVVFVFDANKNHIETKVRVGDFGVAPQLPVPAFNEAVRRLRVLLDRYMSPKQFPFQGGGDTA